MNRKIAILIFIISLILITISITFIQNREKTDKNKIIIAFDSRNQPFIYKQHGAIIGLDVDILNAFAKKYKYSIQWLNTSNGNIDNLMQSNQIDIGAGGMYIRNNNSFTVPYYSENAALITTTHFPKIKSLEDISKYTIGIHFTHPLSQSMQNILLKHKIFTNSKEMMTELIKGSLDGIILTQSSYFIYKKYKKFHSIRIQDLKGVKNEICDYGFFINPEKKKLLQQLDSFILNNNKMIKKYVIKWIKNKSNMNINKDSNAQYIASSNMIIKNKINNNIEEMK